MVFQWSALEDTDMKFVEPQAPMQLAIYVDEEHATDLTTRRSIIGMVDSLNGT